MIFHCFMMGSMVDFSQQSYDSIIESQCIPDDCVIESSEDSESVSLSAYSYCPRQPAEKDEIVISESEPQTEDAHHSQSLAQTVRHSFSDGSLDRPNASSQAIPESSDDVTIPETQSQISTIYSINEYVPESQDDVIPNSQIENVPPTSLNEEIISETSSDTSSNVVLNVSAVVQRSDSYFVEESESGDDDLNDENASVNDDVRTIFSIQSDPFRLCEETKAILKQIEDLMLSAITDLANGNKLKITVQNRSTWSNCTFEDEKFSLRPISSAKCRNVQSTFSLSLIFFVLKEIHGLLLTNQKCTMRELYYKDVKITQKQENVAEALKIICCLLDKTPWQLGVMSSSKGIISGPLQIYLPENLIIDCSIHKTGMTLPHFTADIGTLTTTADYVLVVEKDTVFKKLVQCNIMDRWNHKCILITGKGYPDMNTRLILKKIYETYSLPIYVITDGDPYGIEIMLTYRHGSLSMSNLSNELAVPSIRWLGIFPSDIKKFGIKSIPLTQEDKRKLQNILNRPYINDDVHRELLIMKQINLKAEIEGISDSSCSYLIDVYLRNKIDTNNAI